MWVSGSCLWLWMCKEASWVHEEVVLLFYRGIEPDGVAPDKLGAWWVFVDIFVLTTSLCECSY